MHMDKFSRAGGIVQIVDVLGHEQELALETGFEAGERMVRGIRPDAGEAAPPLVIEIVDPAGIAREAVGRRIVAPVMLGPDAVGVTEARDARFDRDAGPGQDDDGGGGQVAVSALRFKLALMAGLQIIVSGLKL